MIFWISVGKQKTQEIQNIQKFRAPQKGLWIFAFLFFGLRRRHYKIKNPKSKTFLRGPKLLFFLVFLGFWFSNRNQKKHRVVLVFHQRPNKKITKNPVLFGFPPKIQKNMCFFGFLLENQKTLGKPKNPKVSGPSERFWILEILFFLVSPVVTCDLLNCFLLVSTGILRHV